MASAAARALAVAGAVVVLLVGGCGEEDKRGGELERVRTTTETLLELCAEGRSVLITDLLTPPAREEFVDAGGPREGCQRLLRLGDESGAPSPHVYRAARVARAERRGDVAYVDLRHGERQSTIYLQDTGVRWLVANADLYEPVQR